MAKAKKYGTKSNGMNNVGRKSEQIDPKLAAQSGEIEGLENLSEEVSSINVLGNAVKYYSGDDQTLGNKLRDIEFEAKNNPEFAKRVNVFTKDFDSDVEEHKFATEYAGGHYESMDEAKADYASGVINNLHSDVSEISYEQEFLKEHIQSDCYYFNKHERGDGSCDMSDSSVTINEGEGQGSERTVQIGKQNDGRMVINIMDSVGGYAYVLESEEDYQQAYNLVKKMEHYNKAS